MRVVLSFLAFGIICILIPPMISSLMPEEDLVEQQLMQGADPTQILEKTAAGNSVDPTSCDPALYLFGKSNDGVLFVQDRTSSLLAFSSEADVEVLDMGEMPKRLSHGAQGAEEVTRLGSVLKHCSAGGQEPESSDLNISKLVSSLSE